MRKKHERVKNMVEFRLGDPPQVVEFDDTLRYADFYVNTEGGQRVPEALEINMQGMLEVLQKAEIPWNELKDTFRLLSRWVHEAPRKRGYRDLALSGIKNLSNEFFFEDWDEGGDFIDRLENSGRIAVEVLRCYGETPVGPITNDDPVVGVSTEEILKS